MFIRWCCHSGHPSKTLTRHFGVWGKLHKKLPVISPPCFPWQLSCIFVCASVWPLNFDALGWSLGCPTPETHFTQTYVIISFLPRYAKQECCKWILTSSLSEKVSSLARHSYLISPPCTQRETCQTPNTSETDKSAYLTEHFLDIQI